MAEDVHIRGFSGQPQHQNARDKGRQLQKEKKVADENARAQAECARRGSRGAVMKKNGEYSEVKAGGVSPALLGWECWRWEPAGNGRQMEVVVGPCCWPC